MERRRKRGSEVDHLYMGTVLLHMSTEDYTLHIYAFQGFPYPFGFQHSNHELNALVK